MLYTSFTHTRRRLQLVLRQQQYVELATTGIWGSALHSPLTPYLRLDVDDTTPTITIREYLSIVGKIVYASRSTYLNMVCHVEMPGDNSRIA